jgi:hypothetical protein
LSEKAQEMFGQERYDPQTFSGRLKIDHAQKVDQNDESVRASAPILTSLQKVSGGWQTDIPVAR